MPNKFFTAEEITLLTLFKNLLNASANELLITEQQKSHLSLVFKKNYSLSDQLSLKITTRNIRNDMQKSIKQDVLICSKPKANIRATILHAAYLILDINPQSSVQKSKKKSVEYCLEEEGLIKPLYITAYILEKLKILTKHDQGNIFLDEANNCYFLKVKIKFPIVITNVIKTDNKYQAPWQISIDSEELIENMLAIAKYLIREEGRKQVNNEILIQELTKHNIPFKQEVRVDDSLQQLMQVNREEILPIESVSEGVTKLDKVTLLVNYRETQLISSSGPGTAKLDGLKTGFDLLYKMNESSEPVKLFTFEVSYLRNWKKTRALTYEMQWNPEIDNGKVPFTQTAFTLSLLDLLNCELLKAHADTPPIFSSLLFEKLKDCQMLDLSITDGELASLEADVKSGKITTATEEGAIVTVPRYSAPRHPGFDWVRNNFRSLFHFPKVLPVDQQLNLDEVKKSRRLLKN